MLDFIFLTIVFIYLVIASIYDIKTREVPDFLSYSLLAIALFFNLAKSIYYSLSSFIIQSLFALFLFLTLSFFLYYTKQWGGGDTKLLIALGVSFPVYPEFLLNYFSPNLSMPFLFIFLINLAVFGSLYSIFYSFLIVLSKKNSLKHFNKKYLIFLFSSIFLILISLFTNNFLSLLLILFSLIILYPFLYHFIKIFEKNFMYKTLPLSKITEGDWLAENVYKNKKLILSKNLPGLTLEDIKRLKSLKIKQVKIKYGLPFIPSFLIAYIFSLIFGSLI